ncbi:hypothetical protein [Alkalihalobacillus sp. CinArs1]|uniref:hypothetical protein n=1 Tax=Alkalihalobacillus sp. CinArs1 TaxID=2995314 RepID=UPI0022DD1F21|nr:hypothetical protein [Alkalihalobacillus sp. CinArs1]
MRDLDHELEELEQEMKQPLQTYMATSPRSEDTQKLILSLQDSFDELKQHDMEFDFDTEPEKPSLFKQCLNQFRSYHWLYWMISLGIFAMLTLITAGSGDPDGFFPLLVPIYLLFGILYSYKSWNKEMRMIESVTPFPPALLLLSKLLVVLCVNFSFAFVSTVVIISENIYVEPRMFLLQWVAPLFFLTGLLAYIMFHKGVIAGFVSALAGWVFTFIALPYSIYQINDGFSNFLLGVAYLALFVIGGLLLFLSYRKSLHLQYM